MDAVSAAASVITIVELAGKIAKLCFEYSRETWAAKDEILQLQQKLLDMQRLLSNLEKVLKKHSNDELRVTSELADGLVTCRETLAGLEKRLSPPKGRRTMHRIGIRSLRWPFESGEVERIVKDLQGYQSMFDSALQIDQTLLLVGLHRKMDDLKISVDERSAGANTHSRPVLPIHMLPFSKNNAFVGRQAQLTKLQEKLFLERKSQKFGLSGLGGVGKTQIALQFAFWVKDTHPQYSIFWLPALSHASFSQACVDAIGRLGVTLSKDEDPRETFRRHLSSDRVGDWLIILDNMDDMDLYRSKAGMEKGISEFLPVQANGSMLFTTRHKEAAIAMAGPDFLEVLQMGPDDAVALLTGSLVEDDDEKQRNAEIVSDAKDLVRELEFHPLAISQAAAYVNFTGISYRQYLRMLRGTDANMKSLLSRAFLDHNRYPTAENAIATTWLVSFDKVRSENTLAFEMLCSMSCLEPRAIPLAILPQSSEDEEFTFALGLLRSYSFVKMQGHKTCDMHRLVHLAIRIWLENHDKFAGVVHCITSHLFCSCPPLQQRASDGRLFFPHAVRVVGQESCPETWEKYWICNWIGAYLRSEGRQMEGIPWQELCHNWLLKNETKGAKNRFISARNLSTAYCAIADIRKSVSVIENVLELSEISTSGEGGEALIHALETDNTREMLGDNWSDQSSDGSLELTRRLACYNVNLSAEDAPDRLDLLIQLANAYNHSPQHRTKSLHMIQTVVKALETIPRGNPAFLYEEAQATMARALCLTGQAHKAIEILELLISKIEQSESRLGAAPLYYRGMLANAYLESGKHDEALTLYKFILENYKGSRGPRDVGLMILERQMAQVYDKAGQIPQSVGLLEQVIAKCELWMDSEQLWLLETQFELADSYSANGETGKAITILEDLNSRHELGLRLDRLLVQLLLALLYLDHGQSDQAVDLLEHLNSLPELSPFVHRECVQHGLALAYMETEQPNLAIALLEYLNSLDKLHPTLNRSAVQSDLSLAYHQNGQFDQAIGLMEMAIVARKAEVSNDDDTQLGSQRWCLEFMYERREEENKNDCDYEIEKEEQQVENEKCVEQSEPEDCENEDSLSQPHDTASR